MSQARAKDELDGKDYCKLLKGNIGELRETEFNVISMEKLVETYRDFFVDVAEKTQRMNEGPVRQGATKAFEISNSVSIQFAKRVTAAFRFCVEKSRTAVTGARLAPAVAAVVKVLRAKKKDHGVKQSIKSRKSPCGKALPAKTPVKKAEARQASPKSNSAVKVDGRGSELLSPAAASNRKDSGPMQGLPARASPIKTALKRPAGAMRFTMDGKKTEALSAQSVAKSPGHQASKGVNMQPIATDLRTPEQQRKRPTHRSPTWSLPATPASQRGMPVDTVAQDLALVPASPLAKKPAARTSLPSRLKKTVSKRPATQASKNKDKVSVGIGAEGVKARASVWLPSQSFGFVRLGCYTAKSYILFKAKEADKQALLVNVQGTNVDHKKIATELLDYVRRPGLDKTQVVAHKNSLL